MKATAFAPSNIAFIKYWGKKDEALRIPENGSISMNLSGMTTKTMVEFSSHYQADEVVIDGKIIPQPDRITAHLNRIRDMAGFRNRAKVVSGNSFPAGTGLSSSASGFAALTVAGAEAAGLRLSEKELSMLARQGSGSACRSVPDGFTEWLGGDSDDTSYAVSLYPPEHWDIVDIVAVVTQDPKEIPTTEGMKGLRKSPFSGVRLSDMDRKIAFCKKLIKARDFCQLGELVESEALEMHAVMITQIPALLYWTTGTLRIMNLVQAWRREGLPVYFTINTGQNIHILTLPETEAEIGKRLHSLRYVRDVISNHPTSGTRLVTGHLF
ncbi:diphosphomevalonate decarboxylase [Candidatus Gottesmanbacteria bacterium RBG_16_52_11]|uniref:diphosphomevalonate decarboxylase n=1 Tax=Candidatus Gottesmanbacteria bacterium RBG_16_52_11 TaxID=1798374 RepID=A0A1F5YNN1_9BACT|nr:MAG: diphosphomevalonate decarboxylase [Candidatus Gottesmanbacteria bacterium RBG_16_52_11]